MSTKLIVMGVSGCGKSTLGKAVAQRWGVPFVEGDELHSAESVTKMAAGVPLEDADRWPWLDRIGSSMLEAGAKGLGEIASCSALRHAYRDRLRRKVGPNLRFVMIDLPRAVLERRMRARAGHYMPPSLLDSQLRTLERPDGEHGVLIIDGRASVDEMVAAVTKWREALLTSNEAQ